MKLLFVRFSSLGDVILTTGVMNRVKQALPDAELDVLTFKQYAPVFDSLPFVNNVIAYDKSRGLKEYFYLVQSELEDHDHIFDLHGKLRSKFLRFHSQASYHCYKKDSRARRSFVRNKKENERLNMHVVQKYFETVIKPLNLNLPFPEELRPVLKRDVEKVNGRILVHPFASRATKAYPYPGELAEELLSAGYTPVFAGMGKAPDMDRIIDKTGALPLEELLDTIASCEGVISSDSGPMHAAIGLGKPTVGIFGSTTRHFGFYPDFSGCAVLENNDIECRPCDVHGLVRCPKGHFDCMKKLTPGKAVSMLKKIL